LILKCCNPTSHASRKTCFSLPILILEDIMLQTTWPLFITKHYRTFVYSSNMPFRCSSFHLQQIKNPIKSHCQSSINLCLKASKKKLHKKGIKFV
jgi:hypothetical protein